MSLLYSQMYHESTCFPPKSTNHGTTSNTHESFMSPNHDQTNKTFFIPHFPPFICKHLPLTISHNPTTKPSSKSTNTPNNALHTLRPWRHLSSPLHSSLQKIPIQPHRLSPKNPRNHARRQRHICRLRQRQVPPHSIRSLQCKPYHSPRQIQLEPHPTHLCLRDPTARGGIRLLSGAGDLVLG